MKNPRYGSKERKICLFFVNIHINKIWMYHNLRKQKIEQAVRTSLAVMLNSFQHLLKILNQVQDDRMTV